MAGLNFSKASLKLFSDFAKAPKIQKQYRMVKPLGEGGMGVVFLAQQVDLCRDVAIKCVRTDTFAGEDGLKRFIREARVLASLEHPGIVRVFDVDQLDDLWFIVSEFIDGETLKDR